MDKQLKTVWQFIKANPITMTCLVVAIVITVSTIVYSRNHSTSLQRKQVESEVKLAQAIDSSKKMKSEREKAETEAKKKAEEVKAAEELKLLEEKKAAEQAAAIAATEATKKKAAQTSQQATAGSISLTAGTPISYDGKTKIPVSWTAGFNSEKGYKLVWNTTGSPVYPGSEYQYHSEAGSNGNGYVKAFSPGTYYIRVCEYLGGSCGTYSNQIVITIP